MQEFALPRRRRWVQTLTVLWLIGWAFFSLPVSSLRWPPRFRRANLIPFHGTVRAGDAARNMAAYLPAGILGLEMGLAAGPTIAIAAGLSAVAETVQLYSRHRFPSTTDLVFNTAGAAAGALLWRRRRQRADRAG